MLDTPSVMIDINKMQKNIDKMAHMASRNGVYLRPHSKTHKIPDIAKLQIKAGAKGITAAKISEAEVMANHGIDDIFIAFPLVTESKIERAMRLNERIHLIVGVDSFQGAKKLSEMAKRFKTPIKVRLEVDTGLKRTGVVYDQAITLAYQIQAMDHLQLQGIYTYRGSFMDGKVTLDREKAGKEEGRLMVELAERMRSEGMAIHDISVGSTPTAPYAAAVKGVTEVRPGTYVFNDRMQAAFGACTLEECAGVVRATVVSRPSDEFIVIDGGSKTFATDVAPDAPPLFLKGFGHIIEAPHAVLGRLSEEHGMIHIHKNDPFQVGDVVHIIPNHICSTINLHNTLFLKGRGKVEEKRIEARGRLY